MDALLAPASFVSAQIVARGSSAVRGNVPENEMWPAVLEGMLRARGSEGPCNECWSLGRYDFRAACAGFQRRSRWNEDRHHCASMPITTAIDLPGNQLTSLTMIPLQILRATKSKLVARGIKVIDAMPIYLFVNRELFIRAWKEIRWRRFWREC
jgi:acyl-CoA thioesterase-1